MTVTAKAGETYVGRMLVIADGSTSYWVQNWVLLMVNHVESVADII